MFREIFLNFDYDIIAVVVVVVFLLLFLLSLFFCCCRCCYEFLLSFQVDLLFQLYSNAVQLTLSVSADASTNESESIYPARSISSTVAGPGRSARRTASITSSSGFDVVDDESVSSESTPKPIEMSPETQKVCIHGRFVIFSN